MRRIDLLIGGVIVLAVVFSFVGVATYEAVAGDTEFDVTWNTTTRDLPEKSASGTTASEIRVDIPIDLNNLTKVDLKVQITGNTQAPRAGQVNFEIKVLPKNASEPQPKTGNMAQGSTSTATVSHDFSITVQGAPNATTESGADENATLRKLADENTSEKGKGTWSVVVRASGGGAPVVGNTETYRVVVIAKAFTYSVSVQPHTPDVNR